MGRTATGMEATAATDLQPAAAGILKCCLVLFVSVGSSVHSILIRGLCLGMVIVLLGCMQKKVFYCRLVYVI